MIIPLSCMWICSLYSWACSLCGIISILSSKKYSFGSILSPILLLTATNFIDMAYYPFSKSRLTTASFAVIEHEQNIAKLIVPFLGDYWYLFLWFFSLIALWIYLYKRVKVQQVIVSSKKSYYFSSIFTFFGSVILIIMAIRGGGFTSDTRPINMLDASRHVNISAQADAILNTSLLSYPQLRKE